jgi:nucleotide-binding universal stress UspA family protein
MKVLTCVDGSQWSGRALQHASRFLSPTDELVLLYVAPRGGPGYVESGQMVLEASLRASGLDRDLEAYPVTVRPRLCIGDPKEMIPKVAEQEEADVILMGALGVDGFPHVSDMSETARETAERTNCPVVVCSPRGLELLLKEGRLVTQPRSELARLSRALATGPQTRSGLPVTSEDEGARAGAPAPNAALTTTADERERVNRGWRLLQQLSK